VEHIIQDGGTPGIEDFAREVGAEFFRDGKLVFGSRLSAFGPRRYRLAIYSEADAGMYDAINRGISKMEGDLWAWINRDEQYLPGTLDYVTGWFAEHPSARCSLRRRIAGRCGGAGLGLSEDRSAACAPHEAGASGEPELRHLLPGEASLPRRGFSMPAGVPSVTPSGWRGSSSPVPRSSRVADHSPRLPSPD